LRKKIAIFLSLIYLSGCSVLNLTKQDIGTKGRIFSDKIILDDIEGQNLSLKSFYIQKAKIRIVSDGHKENILASIKFLRPDSFLISIRSGSGIEAARIFLTDDTILINDRINRKFYYGSQKATKIKYGIDAKFFPLIFGDLVMDKKDFNGELNCKNSYSFFDTHIEGYLIKYKIDCNKRKAVSCTLINEIETKAVVFDYKDFKNNLTGYSVSGVSIKNFNKTEVIDIEFSRVENPFYGQIQFIPGKNYELVEIK
jgi:hypothetical protein